MMINIVWAALCVTLLVALPGIGVVAAVIVVATHGVVR